MADIAMCSIRSSRKCPRRRECYRARALPSRRQTYSGFQPGTGPMGGCKHFAEIRPGDRLQDPGTIEGILRACLGVDPE